MVESYNNRSVPVPLVASMCPQFPWKRRRNAQTDANQNDENRICKVPAQNIIRQGEREQPVRCGGSNHTLGRRHRLREAIRRAQRLLVGSSRSNVHECDTCWNRAPLVPARS